MFLLAIYCTWNPLVTRGTPAKTPEEAKARRDDAVRKMINDDIERMRAEAEADAAYQAKARADQRFDRHYTGILRRINDPRDAEIMAAQERFRLGKSLPGDLVYTSSKPPREKSKAAVRREGQARDASDADARRDGVSRPGAIGYVPPRR